MENLFLKVLSMSATASAVILLVLLARLLLRKAPKAFSYALWAVVLFRLLCPVTFDSVFALAPAVQIKPRASENVDAMTIDVSQREVTIAVGGAPAYVPAPAQPVTANVPSQAQTRPDPEPGEAASAFTPWTAVSAVWLAGTVLMLGYSLASLLRLRRRLVGWVPLEGEKNVRLADHIPSPFVLGVLRPNIYLPSDLPENERDYILLHERTHIRRFDHIFRALAWLAVAVHWFNPLVWLAFHLAGRDMEMSCDEAVLRKMGTGIRADYSSSLLRLSAGGKLPAGPLAFGAGDPTGRIKNVLGYKKPALWVVVAALAVVVCAGVALATNPGAAARPCEAGDLPSYDLTDGLTLSLEQRDGRTFVRMDGAVDGVELPRGAFWYPEPSAFENFPDGYLSVVYPAFTDGIEGSILAGWTDESRTSVTLSTQMQAMLSSYAPSGWWRFTVELDSGAVTEMAPSSMWDETLDAEVRLYPGSISDGEAVKAARVAAKLLTAAEDYYNNRAEDYHNGPTVELPPLYTALLEGAPFYSVDEGKTLTFDTIAETLDPDGVGYEITRYTSVDLDGDGAHELILYVEQQGAFYFILHDADGELYGYLCGAKAMPSIKRDGVFWDNYVFSQEWDRQGMGYSKVSFTKTGLEFHPFTYEVSLPGDLDEADKYRFVVDGQPADSEAYSAALAAQDAKPDVVWYEFSPKGYNVGPAPAQPSASTDLANLDGLSFSDGWNDSVTVEGLDVKEMYWYSPSRYSPQGRLFFTNPAFFGPAFAGRQIYGNIAWADDSHTQMEGCLQVEDYSYLNFTIETGEGRVSPSFTGLGFSDQEMIVMAQTCALLMEQAEAYKTSDAYRPVEDGPLPFDRPMELDFLSGAGAWRTHLLLHPDGSFVGDYEDADMTIHYVCPFHGRFGDITQVTDTSWSLTLDELVLDTQYPIGQEWDEGAIHYISSSPYGFDSADGEPLEPGAQFMLYTPDARGYAPGDDLYGAGPDNTDYDSIMYQFWSWWPHRHAWGPYGDTLGCYGLCNMETGYGFFSD